MPALTIDGRRVQTTTKIARALDELQPEPRLVPDDPRALEAEAWADDVLQDNARRLGQWAAKRDPSALLPIALASRLMLPSGVVRATMPVLAPVILPRFTVADEDARTRLAELPAHLDRVDAWLADGVLGGARRTSRITGRTSLRRLTLLEQVRPLVERRPAGRFALVRPGTSHGIVVGLPRGRGSTPLGRFKD